MLEGPKFLELPKSWNRPLFNRKFSGRCPNLEKVNLESQRWTRIEPSLCVQPNGINSNWPDLYSLGVSMIILTEGRGAQTQNMYHQHNARQVCDNFLHRAHCCSPCSGWRCWGRRARCRRSGAGRCLARSQSGPLPRSACWRTPPPTCEKQTDRQTDRMCQQEKEGDRRETQRQTERKRGSHSLSTILCLTAKTAESFDMSDKSDAAPLWTVGVFDARNVFAIETSFHHNSFMRWGGLSILLWFRVLTRSSTGPRSGFPSVSGPTGTTPRSWTSDPEVCYGGTETTWQPEMHSPACRLKKYLQITSQSKYHETIGIGVMINGAKLYISWYCGPIQTMCAEFFAMCAKHKFLDVSYFRANMLRLVLSWTQ